MKRFAFFSDLLFTFFVSVLLSLCLFRFIDVGFWLSLFLSAFCAGLITSSVGAYLQSKRKHLLLKRKDEQEKERLLLHLALLSDGAKTEFFKTALSSDAPLQRFSLLRLHNEKRFYFLHFKLSPVNADDVAKYSRLKTGKEKILLCGNIDESAKKLCDRLHIQVKTGEDVYVWLRDLKALPQIYLGDDASKEKRGRIRFWFSKKNSKRFLISATFILLLSLMTPFFTYYLCMGVLLLFLSVFTRIFGKAEV